MLVLEFPLHENAGDRCGSKRKVEDACASVDDDQTLRTERVQRADAESEQREPDYFVHLPPRSMCIPRSITPACSDIGALDVQASQ